MHAAASIVTFTVWTALPFVDAGRAGSTRARVGNLLLGAVTTAGFVGAAVTTRSDDQRKGVAQRCFLGAVVARYVAVGAQAMRARTSAAAVPTGRRAPGRA